LFVVLQVILSIALTAAVVVYVSREDAQLANLKAANTAKAAAEAERDAAIAAMTAATNNANAIQEAKNAQATQLNSNLTAAQQQIADLNVRLAKADTSNATAQLEITRLTEGLKAATDMSSNLNQTVAQLRTSSDEAVKKAAEMSAQISDLDNRLQVTERERRNLAEQLAQAQQDTQKLSRALQDRGMNPQDVIAGRVEPRNAGVAINGVVRDTRRIADVPYATISVGSADDVQRGMEFKVVDNGQFLGTLTVDTVEQQEATGVLKGPKIDAIKPGVQVRTQY
jgi:chromosome segregation ATPase